MATKTIIDEPFNGLDHIHHGILTIARMSHNLVILEYVWKQHSSGSIKVFHVSSPIFKYAVHHFFLFLIYRGFLYGFRYTILPKGSPAQGYLITVHRSLFHLIISCGDCTGYKVRFPFWSGKCQTSTLTLVFNIIYLRTPSEIFPILKFLKWLNFGFKVSYTCFYY